MQVAYAYDPSEQEHTRQGHPENRQRLAGTLDLLERDGILDRCHRVPVIPATPERLHHVHPEHYIEMVRGVVASGGGQLDADTYVTRHSFDAARAAVGALIEVVIAVVDGSQRCGISLIRPPGHHALVERAMGFCIFANVAIAARTAQRELGIERVLVVDWDVHHGNGTEVIFYDDPSVAFFSTHQYPFYPGTGAATDVGHATGYGYTLNVPLPSEVGDEGYMRVFEELLTPFAERFRPELILVSAGYDAHWRDPLASESLTVAGFARLTAHVARLAERLCGARVVLALEGGYDLEVLPHAVLSSLRMLEDGDAECSDPFGPAPDVRPVPDALMAKLKELHSL